MAHDYDSKSPDVSVSSGIFNHPIGFWFFFWGEFAERCSYYGMRAILAKYMADRLGLGEANAATYMSFFIAACYFLPLIGGFVADRFFGKYWTIVGFSIPYIAGHFILGIENFTFLVTALTLLAMGSGVIKPNISTLMGLTYDEKRPGQTQLRSDAFAIFYFAINFGALISQWAMPPIRTNYGYAVAFLFPAGLMALSFIIFALGKKFYAHETVGYVPRTPEEQAQRWVILGRIVGLFFLVMFFWAIFDQSASTWIFFANACMNCTIFGHEIDPDQIQAFNALFIIVFLPIMTILFRVLAASGIKVRPTDKMLGGFALTAICMGIMALAAYLAGNADLRPADIKGNASFYVPVSTDFVSFDGEMKINQANVSTLTIDKKDIKGESLHWLRKVGSVEVPDTITIKGDELKLASAENGFTLKGAKKIEFTDEHKHPVVVQVLEMPITITPLSGELSMDSRWFVTPAKQVSVWWQVFAYFIITIAEILISVTGLELAYTAAPKSMSGFVTACWLATVGLANLFINAPVTRLYTTMQPMAYFGMLTATLTVVAIAFFFSAGRFNRLVAEQEAGDAAKLKP